MKLPPMCYTVDLERTGFGVSVELQPVVMIKRGERGFYSTNVVGGQPAVDRLNEELGITKGQVQAMVTGSMFGWDTPGADPDTYDIHGNLILTPAPRRPY